MSDSLRSHGLQHARLPCPSPTPGAYSNSCPSHRWCHPTISSSVVPFSHLTYFMMNIIKIHIVVVQSLSHVQFFVTPWTEYTRLACPSLSTGIAQTHVHRESVMLSNDLILCCHLLLPSIFPSIRVFSSEPALCIKWPKYWSFSYISIGMK